MSTIAPICSSTFGNLGAMCEAGNNLAPAVGIILTTDSFEFATAADFADKTKYEDAIKGKQMFPLMNIQEVEDSTEETVYYTSPAGNMIKLRNGKYIFKYNFLLSLKQHQELQKFSSAKLRYFLVDSNNQIRGYSPDGTKFKGFSIANFEAEKMKYPTYDAPAFSPINITEQNASQWNGFGAVITPDWEAEDLASLANVTITVVGTPTSTSLNIKVGSIIGLNSDGTDQEIAVKGIVTGDFEVLKASDGSSQTVTFVDNGDGTYTGTGTSLETGTVDIKDPSSMSSTGLLIESTGAVSFTI